MLLVCLTGATKCNKAALGEGSPDFEAWNEEELQAIKSEMDKLKEEMDKESEIDISEVSEDEGEEKNVSDPDDSPLANLQSKWRTASNTQPFLIRPFTRNVGQHHNLPTSASVLDFFFMFLPQLFFDLAAAETNRYAMQKAAERGLPDSAWQETTPEEI